LSPNKQKINLDFKGSHSIAELLGDGDKLIKIIERKYNVEIFVLGDNIEISGKSKNVKDVSRLIEELTLQINLGQMPNPQKIDDSIKIMENESRRGISFLV